MTKVCIFCEEWGSGGIETYILNVLSHIDLSQFEISIVTARLNTETYFSKLNKLGINLTVLPVNGISRHFHLRAFQRTIHQHGFDVIYFNLYEGLALSYVWLAKLEGVPVRIVHSHNTDLRKSPTRFFKLAVHNICKHMFGGNATCKLACSKAAAEFLFSKKEIENRNWKMIPNGIEIERFRFNQAGREATREELHLHKEIAIGCIGRLCFQKNQLFLLKAFRIAHERQPDSRLFFVGEGDDLEILKRQTCELGLDEAVVFYGTTDQIPSLLWAFDILALPSVFEGLGIVAIEAQAAGLPVLCSDQVPGEVYITDLAVRLPLDDVSLWSDELIRNAGQRRYDTEKALRMVGYSIQDVAIKLQDLWKSE